MKLQAMIEAGFVLKAWAIKRYRGDRRLVVKLSKQTVRGEKFYVVHTPYTDSMWSGLEFTEPVLLHQR